MKYVRCDGCSNLIVEGSTVYQFPGRCGIFCSPQCFADYYADHHELTEELADNCRTAMITIREIPNDTSDTQETEYEVVQSFATPGQIAKRKFAPYMEGVVVKIVNDEEFICEVQGSNIICHKDFWSFSDADT